MKKYFIQNEVIMKSSSYDNVITGDTLKIFDSKDDAYKHILIDLKNNHEKIKDLELEKYIEVKDIIFKEISDEIEFIHTIKLFKDFVVVETSAFSFFGKLTYQIIGIEEENLVYMLSKFDIVNDTRELLNDVFENKQDALNQSKKLEEENPQLIYNVVIKDKTSI